ncbi:unnamed protein product [Adineta steineri]|uniref:EGF-like domain-containing protein n=1 Tax=Adineta steineri TaxID=433720 RepID=A0A815JA11_9BILA|nr:unnamed protein product [Adineta steineri]CAF1604964.1 unnamed protein product [Adineta steineri]
MIFLGALLNVLFTMRIPYLNIPCIVNETCFHGQCIHVDDYLINWYEFCLCDHSYSGYECNEQTKLSRTDCFLKDDFYPQIIECTRSTPYVEVSSPNSVKLTGMRIYRIPSEHLSRRQTIIDGLIPLHTISSLAYLTHFSNPRFQRRNEQIHTSTNEFN